MGSHRQEVIEGPGDDAAVVRMGNEQWTICADTMVAGVHFIEHQNAYDVGFKSLAVNLSDTLAMGAEPVWAILCITHPTGDEEWIQQFSQGFDYLAKHFGVCLIGGDTTRGPLSVSVTVGGRLSSKAVLRSGANIGDTIFLSSTLGDAAIGLKMTFGDYRSDPEDHEFCLNKLNQPLPDISMAPIIRQWATAAIDISDGLLGDLNHILQASHNVGAQLNLSTIPLSPAGQRYIDRTTCWETILAGGDDYILCFCVAENEANKLKNTHVGARIFSIGKITSQPGIHFLNEPEGFLFGQTTSFNHF